MKKLTILFFTLIINYSFSQEKKVDFDKFIELYKEPILDTVFFEELEVMTYYRYDSITENLLYKDKLNGYKLTISENPYYLDLEEKEFKLPNINLVEKFKNYPVSPSVIYENKIISLFEKDNFICHDLNTLERDREYEKLLNQKTFNFHWVIDSELFAIHNEKIFKWDGEKWIKTKINFPFSESPKPIFYDDDEFLVFSDCRGEWGANTYFYQRENNKTLVRKTNCLNTVNKDKNTFRLTTSINHMVNFSEIYEFQNLKNFVTTDKKKELNYEQYKKISGDIDKDVVVDMRGFLLKSNFKLKERDLFLVSFDSFTFIAELNNDELQIVNPLFNNSITYQDLITRKYEDYYLISSLKYFDHLVEREDLIILIHNNKLIKIDWR
ncbi:hypothetical protein [Aureivirga sp. CE67]|uniref:hypothetical protein n=1 Tax=Aureivirga sp. CE67 TaxID=1788983 RepID=UPI0018C993A3|nr:hypothetical protein [Aureivirga sp. CE67]